MKLLLDYSELMAQSTVIIPDNAETFSHAWYAFMAYYRRETGYREHFHEMRRPKLNETQEETDHRIIRAEMKERDWKWDLLSEIRDNKFMIFGRDITNGISAPISVIPSRIFEEGDLNVSINWELNQVTAYDRIIIDIYVVPAAEQILSVEVRKKMGRPSVKGIEDAIETLIASNPGFAKLTRPEQCDCVRERIHGPDVSHVDPPKNYRDGAIKTRLRKMIPS